ncbi:MAG: hypothetical protein M3541_19505 [Acidobacteriota bacterium]|nr:hypothetical protein [Acidobacteriota bacterium]MDQ3420926.1 hypothetical protein [Acidobacteriota bacterium]
MKADAPPMTDRVAAILLGGWLAEPPGGSAHGFGEGLYELASMNDEQIVAFWRLHERYLRAHAGRLGIEPTWDAGGAALVFFGESLAYELASRTARG